MSKLKLTGEKVCNSDPKHPEVPLHDLGCKVCICGGGGFIGSWLGKALKDLGYHVIVADWKHNEYFKQEEYCHEFRLLDLRKLENCIEATKGCTHVYALAADMGGMGFIESNQSVLLYNNTMVSFNCLESARVNGAKRFFYSSTACVYNEDRQLDVTDPKLKEEYAWPAKPQDSYGLEKLYAEEMALTYGKDFGIAARIARFHNIYGPNGTWQGGREKAPAAFCRKAITSTVEFEMWGDGIQTRSFVFVEDCVEGVIRIMMSDCDVPLNLGTEEMISMNDFAKLVMSYESKDLPIKHIPGPQGVRGRPAPPHLSGCDADDADAAVSDDRCGDDADDGSCRQHSARNSDNTLIREKIGWEAGTPLAVGIKTTYFWIKEQVEKMKASGKDTATLSQSKIVVQDTAVLDGVLEKGFVRAADGTEKTTLDASVCCNNSKLER
ncbi:unnamed protein product [Prorocentrum cordatum]|uniref:NAD-dependent epimerase/dehydratase domain-containing protein n=1 Tax=Prorocentrum cordatum TaxID=2364126 RepID=A0ABN9R1X4_9DINO|nr:unnamed protein product [Polarella glacialis]